MNAANTIKPYLKIKLPRAVMPARCKRASRSDKKDWIPAFAGMTTNNSLFIKSNFEIRSTKNCVMGILLSLLLLATATPAQGQSSGPYATINELAAAYSIDKCIECHSDIHEEWAQSWHAKSIIDSRILRTWRTFILRGLDSLPSISRSKLKEACIRCHSPQIRDASDALVVNIADLIVTAEEDNDAATREAAIKTLSPININCITCHVLRGSPDGAPSDKTIYGPTGSGVDPHREVLGLETVKSEFFSTSEFCAQCHHGCPPGMPSSQCLTVYSSYKEDYLAGGGTKRCQDCHMRKGDKISHRFPGIFEIETAREGIELHVESLPTVYVYHLENRMVPAVVIKAHVKNTAGHLIPYG